LDTADEERTCGDEEGGTNGHRHGNLGEEVRRRHADARTRLADETRQQHGAKKRPSGAVTRLMTTTSMAALPRKQEKEAQCVRPAQRPGAVGEPAEQDRHGEEQMETAGR
jgi:hypothetical protein